ncbi:MAG TPA: TonB family protein [Candidatus Acidoferrales bacterium]|jgi:protein TonB|nr:TonB family protein [Candidatus Acidoferrales bacterium]
MFEEMVVSTSTNQKTNKPWTVALSMIFQVVFLAILILIPLIYTEALPKTLMSSILLAPPPPPPPPPPPATVQVIRKPVQHLMDAGKLVTPKAIPKDIKIIKEEAEPPDMGMAGGVPGGVAGGSAGGALGGVIGGAGNAPPPPPKASPKRVTVGGNVQAARLVNKVTPLYPPLARQTRISGTVRLHAIIGKNGAVEQLQVVGGHPLLVQSALDAVRQWRYQPTLLNGDPVEVDTEIDVVFSLAQ